MIKRFLAPTIGPHGTLELTFAIADPAMTHGIFLAHNGAEATLFAKALRDEGPHDSLELDVEHERVFISHAKPHCPRIIWNLESTLRREFATRAYSLYLWGQEKGPHWNYLRDRKDYHIGIDFDKERRDMDVIRRSGLFHQEFLDDYRKIGERIHRLLIKKKIKYAIDLPWNPDAYPWCECQDDPIYHSVKNIEVSPNIISMRWPAWSHERIVYKKEDGDWKIAYLPRFDLEKF